MKNNWDEDQPPFNQPAYDFIVGDPPQAKRRSRLPLIVIILALAIIAYFLIRALI